MFELIYTSAPRGLLQGRSGYTTVALTAGMPPNLILPVENLSGYSFTLRDGQFSAAFNPVSCSYRKVRFGNMVLRVASRIAPCGLDYSGRNNKIAHHLIFESPDEAGALSGGAAEAFLADGNFRTGYAEEPRTLPARRVHAAPTPFAPPARMWETMTGDAGYAAMIALRLLMPERRPFYLACPAAAETAELVTLAAEVAALLTPEQREQFTFTTYFDREQPGEECFLRMVPDFSPALNNLRKFHPHDLLDLTMPTPPLPPEYAMQELTRIARFGRRETIEIPPEPPVEELPAPEPVPLAVRQSDAPCRRQKLFLPKSVSASRPARDAAPGPRRPRPVPGAARTQPHVLPPRTAACWPHIALAAVTVLLLVLFYLAFRPLPQENRQNTPARETRPAAPAAAAGEQPGKPQPPPQPPAQAPQAPAPPAAKTAAVAAKEQPGKPQPPPPQPPAQAPQTAAPPAAKTAAAAAGEQPGKQPPPQSRPQDKANRPSGQAGSPPPQGQSPATRPPAAPRRNISPEERKTAQDLWESDFTRSFEWRKNWRKSASKTITIPNGIPKWDRFDAAVSTLGKQSVAGQPGFVTCLSPTEVLIHSGKLKNGRFRPDPDPAAALRIAYKPSSPNVLEITLPGAGAQRPQLSDIEAIYFHNKNGIQVWRPKISAKALRKLRRGEVVLGPDGQLQYRRSKDEETLKQELVVRIGKTDVNKLPKLPLAEWRKAAQTLASAQKNAEVFSKKNMEATDARAELDKWNKKIADILKKLDPGLAEEFDKIATDLAEKQTLAPDGQEALGLEWSKWVKREITSSR